MNTGNEQLTLLTAIVYVLHNGKLDMKDAMTIAEAALLEAEMVVEYEEPPSPNAILAAMPPSGKKQ